MTTGHVAIPHPLLGDDTLTGADLEEEVGGIGEQYGRELRRRGTPLAQAVQAFIFFRKSLDETAKRLSERNRLTPEDAENAREAIAGLADRALIGLTSVYDTELR